MSLESLSMKKVKSLIVFTSIISFLHLDSCNVDKLELVNPNVPTPETYFKTEAEVQQAVNAVYANLQTDGLYQRTLYYSMDFMAFEQLNTVDPIYQVFLRYTFDANNIFIAEYWKRCYAGINRANFVINNEEAINKIPEGLMSQIKKDKYLGEARFLRALYYFLLVTRFGDVPLIIENQDGKTGLPRSPKALVWDQIETDLSSATEKCLPKNMEEKGRATSGAAWALLGKSHLFQANESKDQADYGAAKKAFLHLINDHENYALEDRYSKNFEEETEHGPESIFEVEFNPVLGTDNLWSSDNGSGLNECSLRGVEYGCFNWYNAYPFLDLVEEFETVADNGVKDDPRLGYCIYQTGDLYNNGADIARIDNDTLWRMENDSLVVFDIIYRYGWKKYQNYYKQKSESYYSGINTKVIRLADVLLMMAEVENELGSIPEAIDYLNQVRNRADVMMPNYGTPAMNIIYPVSNQEQLRKAIEHERKIELCSEQVRINDLIRWQRLESFIREEAMPRLPFYLKDAIKFDPAKHYLWPIPQSEIDSNPAITEEDQNYGY
jgi:starch-binding outer membrane protein, SusD/RagB family